MKITKLTLINYKRLLLNNIKEFIYTPDSPYQIILGRNGSGKSSILAELTPLPAVPADYNKGGAKVIELEHRSSHYVLSSTFTSAAKHSFLKDGEELNPGGTATVQRELVRQEFRITPDLHELMTGVVTFTRMTPAKRREWITALSDTDLTYAIGVFNKLRTQNRDSIGALRHVNNRLTSETNKLLAIEDAKSLDARAKEIRDELTLLMENKAINLPEHARIRQSLESNLTRLEQVARTILESNVQKPKGYDFKDEESIAEVLQELRTEQSVTRSLLSKSTEEYAELEKLFETIQAYSAENLEDLKRKVEDLAVTLAEKQQRINTFLVENPEEKLSDSLEATNAFMRLLHVIPDNSDRKFNRNALIEAKEQVKTLSLERDRCQNRIAKAELKVEHILTAKETGCPKCGFVWKEGVSEGDLLKLKSYIEQQSKQMQAYEKRLAEAEEYINKAEEWGHHYRAFSNLVAQYPRLQQLWNHFIDNDLIYNEPWSHRALVSLWETDLETSREIDFLKKEQERLRLALEGAGGQGDTEHLSARFKRLQSDIESLTVQLERCNQTIREVDEYNRRVTNILKLDVEAQSLGQQILKERDLLVEILRNEEIDRAIHHQQSVLANLQHRLNEKNTLEGIIGDLKSSSEDLAVESKALQLLVDHLSPTDGLIAEQLTGFISCLVDQINDVIKQIWTYDLFVLPCGMESGDLDYKFPLQVRSPSNQIADISRASDGQAEIIDFAFMLVAMLYMDFVDYPLYLDELGRACDEQHRVNIVNYIKMLIDGRRHSAVYYISHFASSHGALAGAEVLVLDGANILVPSKSNENVVMN